MSQVYNLSVIFLPPKTGSVLRTLFKWSGQPDTLRNDAQKAQVDAKVSVSSIFSAVSCEVRAEGNEPTVQNGTEDRYSSKTESNTTENHSSTKSSSPQQPTIPPH